MLAHQEGAIKKQTNREIGVGGDMEEKESLCLWVGVESGAATGENAEERPQTAQIRAACDPATPCRCLSRRTEIRARRSASTLLSNVIPKKEADTVPTSPDGWINRQTQRGPAAIQPSKEGDPDTVTLWMDPGVSC